MRITISLLLSFIFQPILNAAQITTYDMASLAYQSDYIVSTETKPVERKSSSIHVEDREIIIKQVFKGDVKPGDKMTLSYFLVPTKMAWNNRDIGDFQEVVLFLRHQGDKLVMVSGGLRLITTENVWAVRQISNPGPLGLWPYGPEFISPPVDYRSREERIKDYKYVLFNDVREAIRRSKIFKKAEAERDLDTLKLFIYPSSDYLTNIFRFKAAEIIREEMKSNKDG